MLCHRLGVTSIGMIIVVVEDVGAEELTVRVCVLKTTTNKTNDERHRTKNRVLCAREHKVDTKNKMKIRK